MGRLGRVLEHLVAAFGVSCDRLGLPKPHARRTKQPGARMYVSPSLKQLHRYARFARCARSLAALVHRGELPLIFLVFLMLYTIFDIVSISIDLSWMFMPTWPHVS